MVAGMARSYQGGRLRCFVMVAGMACSYRGRAPALFRDGRGHGPLLPGAGACAGS